MQVPPELRRERIQENETKTRAAEQEFRTPCKNFPSKLTSEYDIRLKGKDFLHKLLAL